MKREIYSQGTTHSMPVLCTFPFSTNKWGWPSTKYHCTKSISQAILHTPTLTANTNVSGYKIKTSSTLDVTSSAGKYDLWYSQKQPPRGVLRKHL